MNVYTPEAWELIRTKDGEFFIFGAWAGGFASSDHWRRNSGVVSYKEEDNYIDFVGHTGSVYRCNKAKGRMTFFNTGTLNEMLEVNKGSRLVSLKEFKEEFNVNE